MKYEYRIGFILQTYLPIDEVFHQLFFNKHLVCLLSISLYILSDLIVSEKKEQKKNVKHSRDKKVKQGGKDAWNGQTNKRNNTKFEQYLAMMVIYLPIKLDSNQTNCFQVRVWKPTMLTNEQNAKKQMNQQTK